MKKLMMALISGAAAVTLAGSAHANDVSDIYLGVGSASSEYWAAYIEGAKAVAKSLGKDVKVIPSEFDGQKLLEQFGAVLAAGCEDCVVTVDPASNAFTKAMIERTDAAGAKYVNLWNRPDEIHPWDTAPNTWVANISFDGVDSGYQNAMALCNALGGKGNIVALNGIPDNPPAKQRIAGLHKALEECPGLKLLDTQVGNWDQTQGQSITRAWLAKYGDQLNGIFSANDGMALGAVAALREKGLAGKIPVTGSDGSSDVIRLIEKGDMLSTMYIDGYVQGAYAVALASAAVKGDIKIDELKQDQRDFFLSQTLVTKDNAASVLNATKDASKFSYDALKANFWAASVGQIPAGANK
ncbi:sugar ABC transporter substrate-binding protein [Rhizobium redzepovicii]|uniref:sugar ABC transporter substrate-binding protein n=1 Tax=Rhizobium redzepovicii TaxID=2867518 RepID=UPI001C92DC53|nr:sugar ABC transporter substrate-binding protein [Rhizobium redzepovicii]MBY4592604.1 sugar ABC transporter substrate-binding protein [Rhizobium redzepovicii]MBY4615402.1 sugar ABC transporter substrate-binding protein [Rhizobium redzepovicii]